MKHALRWFIIHNKLRTSIALLLFVGFWFVAQYKQGVQACGKVAIHVEDNGHFFIDSADVLHTLVPDSLNPLQGTPMFQIDARTKEKTLYANSYVAKASISEDIAGNLTVFVSQAKPIARIVNASGPDSYLTETGRLLPLSNRYTSRVIVVTGNGVNKLNPKEAKQEGSFSYNFLALIDYINANKFWKAQIAEIAIDGSGELVLMPQVGNQQIEFGLADQIDLKFRKLWAFYAQVIPTKGFNKYTVVKLQYKDQLICQ